MSHIHSTKEFHCPKRITVDNVVDVERTTAILCVLGPGGHYNNSHMNKNFSYGQLQSI